MDYKQQAQYYRKEYERTKTLLEAAKLHLQSNEKDMLTLAKANEKLFNDNRVLAAGFKELRDQKERLETELQGVTAAFGIYKVEKEGLDAQPAPEAKESLIIIPGA